MTTFDDRDKAFENKYARDEEMNFKVNARRNKLLGLWAAGKLGKNGPEAEAYAKEVVMADLDAPGDADMLAKLLGDFKSADINMSEAEIRSEMERMLPTAREQILGTN